MLLRVFGYKEDGQWVAHCLEMDLVGVAKTWKTAFKRLDDAIQAQFSFAEFKGQPELLWSPAPPGLFIAWERGHEERMKAFNSWKAAQQDFISESIPSPEPGHLSDEFHLVHA